MSTFRTLPIATCLILAGAMPGCQKPQAAQPTSAATPAAAAPAATDKDGFRNAFAVPKSSLGPTGGNPYCTLEPGQVRKYTSDEGTLVVTVTDQTRLVDGVTTRVIEEREEEKGALKEVSRNFFAADRATGDVYYFGEEVDIYRNGKVVKHEGAWMSGVKGAHFGLWMPGKPAAGDKYYQELAPGEAMDRFEIVSVEERLETPAGVFEHVVHTKETSPLEKGVGHKWFAPGVGLIKDDESVLVSTGK